MWKLTFSTGDIWARESFCRLKYLWVLKFCMQSANIWLESPRKGDAAFSIWEKNIPLTHLWFQIVYYSAVAIWSFILILLAIIHLPLISASLCSQTLNILINKFVMKESWYFKIDLWWFFATHAYNRPMQTLHKVVKIVKTVQ